MKIGFQNISTVYIIFYGGLKMGISFPTLLVLSYALYCEYTVRQLEKRLENQSIYFLKTIIFPYRLLVYTLNTGFALYNAITGFDDYFMAGVLVISIHLVVNISKIVIEPGQVTIGNTKMKEADFQMVELKPLDAKNAKFTFAMMVRKRRIQRDLYLPLSKMEPLRDALKKLKNSKTDKNSKK
jgi:hypothetical protein